MDPTEAQFRARLDANPEDRTTRAIFADWLEERGDPLHEFHRLVSRRRVWPELGIGLAVRWYCNPLALPYLLPAFYVSRARMLRMGPTFNKGSGSTSEMCKEFHAAGALRRALAALEAVWLVEVTT